MRLDVELGTAFAPSQGTPGRLTRDYLNQLWKEQTNSGRREKLPELEFVEAGVLEKRLKTE